MPGHALSLTHQYCYAAVYTALSPQAQAEEAKQRAAAVLSAATVQTARYVTTVDAHCATSKQCKSTLPYLLAMVAHSRTV